MLACLLACLLLLLLLACAGLLLDAYGRKRLMWASDAPFQVVDGHTYKASIDLIKSGHDFLDDDDRNWLLRKTAERVFF